ncbi:amidohydrolase [Dietzia sp. NCCP-2495]|uniref:amidohydrolase family protein n=1 Tax=Dietzia sp. NCCP-2495 TaxID=2934675 RepID=UPI0022307134|nr:amidohydrolase family protein [Dietzia sp. NCCP-2495]GLB63837.1 amidohydrolase [Dietzia sp. NCCP-2495]
MCESCGTGTDTAYEPGRAPDIAEESRVVRALWEPLGLPGIIDVHTHFMPKNVMDKVWDYFGTAGPKIGRQWPITYKEAEDERVERLRAYGVIAFSSMLYPHRPDMAAWLNSWSVDFAARHPDCLHTSTFFPEPSAGEYVRDAIESGTRVFKSHIQVGEYDPRDPLLDPVWGQLTESRIPTVIHCGGGPVPGEFTGPEPVAAVLERFPDLPLIIAHMGMIEYSDFLDLAEKYPNVYLDTTMAFTDFTEKIGPFPKSDYGRLADLGDKILLGTDFPNIPYPYAEQLKALLSLGVGEEWLRAVWHGNAARLFDL